MWRCSWFSVIFLRASFQRSNNRSVSQSDERRIWVLQLLCCDITNPQKSCRLILRLIFCSFLCTEHFHTLTENIEISLNMGPLQFQYPTKTIHRCFKAAYNISPLSQIPKGWKRLKLQDETKHTYCVTNLGKNQRLYQLIADAYHLICNMQALVCSTRSLTPHFDIFLPIFTGRKQTALFAWARRSTVGFTNVSLQFARIHHFGNKTLTLFALASGARKWLLWKSSWVVFLPNDNLFSI